jgi:DNA polymerase III subunit delta'
MTDFFGNETAVATLTGMMERGRIPQTLLFDGPPGVGKATLARRFAAQLMGHADLIEQDDLSLESNRSLLADREKLSSDKRSDDPFLLATYPDFVTIAPDGPLRQISIQQMRLLKERAQFGPISGSHRVFLIDSIDRANEQAANSLLKTLEEPPPYLIIILTAENSYDLLPTIRSRAVPIRLSRLTEDEMYAFAKVRSLDHAERRIALAGGCPGAAASLDLADYDKKREAMLALLKSAAGLAPFADWARFSEKLALARSEKLEPYLLVLYTLVEDIVHLREGIASARNADVGRDLKAVASRVSLDWLRQAVAGADELNRLLRRSIQKNLALDSFVLALRSVA